MSDFAAGLCVGLGTTALVAVFLPVAAALARLLAAVWDATGDALFLARCVRDYYRRNPDGPGRKPWMAAKVFFRRWWSVFGRGATTRTDFGGADTGVYRRVGWCGWRLTFPGETN